MNIIVKTYKGHIVARPDTTLEKDNEDLYLPDFVSSLNYAPVLFVRIAKHGKAVAEKFAGRYYDCFNYGLLLYTCHEEDGEAFASSLCADKTSFLPTPMYLPEVFNEDNRFSLYKNSEEIFSAKEDDVKIIESAIAGASQRMTLRTGDMLAIELAEKELLADKTEKVTHIKGTFCDNFLMDFKIHFSL